MKFSISLTAGLLSSVLILFSCNKKDDFGIEKLKGHWMIQLENEQWIEQWTDPTDKSLLLEGFSDVVVNGDTTIIEKLHIRQSKDDMLYQATVFNQNGGKPVEFRLVKSDDHTLRFENPQHDYPQFLDYHFPEPTKLNVLIGLRSRDDTPLY